MKATAGLCLGLLALAAVLAAGQDVSPNTVVTASEKRWWKGYNGGQPNKMTPEQIQKCFYSNTPYIPSGKGPDHGVPRTILSKCHYKPWTPKMHKCHSKSCYNPCPNPPPYVPTAWDYISNNPDMTTLTALLKLTGLNVKFEGCFAGTLLAPNNEAFAKLFAQMKVDILDPAYAAYAAAFATRIINYHTLIARVYARDVAAGVGSWPYTTLYGSINGEHRVRIKTININPICPRPNCTELYTFAQGEQGDSNVANFVAWDKLTYCGGVIHTINNVLLPDDVYPSLQALLAGKQLTTLTTVLTGIEAANPGFIQALEQTPATLALPTDAAFAAMPVGVPPKYYLDILQFHQCPVKAQDQLLYARFKSAFNPCLTGLGAAQNNNGLKLTYNYKDYGNDVVIPPAMKITYTSVPSVPGTSKIAMADITTPVGVSHIVEAVLIPPTVPLN
uniref:FAS1 domain-containing protein n=1 Tax=Tetradesmus obliquus TaxID=3088 RepID=A0A383VUI1_TETOB|eukprot:jgi/Sobl393_1/5136/SZX68424.1